jgi:hypothetical protein
MSALLSPKPPRFWKVLPRGLIPQYAKPTVAAPRYAPSSRRCLLRVMTNLSDRSASVLARKVLQFNRAPSARSRLAQAR